MITSRFSGVVGLLAVIFFAGAVPLNGAPVQGDWGGVSIGLSSEPFDGVIRVEAGRVPRDHGPVSREIVAFETTERPGTLIISNSERVLYRVLGEGLAERYRISVGREGFTWSGTVYVGAKSEWPGWRPPADMRARQPSLPEYVPPGPFNPLGARALYLYQGGKDTLYRIHGTNDSGSLGSFQTSGCFRMSNADVMRLFQLVPTGTKVIVR